MKFRSFAAASVALTFLIAAPLHAAEKKKTSAKAAPAAKGAPATTEQKPAPSKPAEVAEIKDPVAVVEGTEIKKAELDNTLGEILAQQGKSLSDVPPEQKPEIYRMLLDEVIVQKLVAKRAAEMKVSDEEVAATFAKFKAQFPSEEELKAQIEKEGQTIESLQQGIRTSLQAQHWVDEQIKGKLEVPEKDAEAFFKENPERFKMPERVRASHILIRVPEEAKPEEVVEKQKAAAAVLARVKKGEEFEKVAAEISDDPSAKENKGDLNFFRKDQMVPEFADAAFKLKKGELGAEPVRSEFGYHVIKVTDRKPPEDIPLEQAKPQVVAFLEQQKREAAMQDLAKELRDKADVKINLP